MSWSKHDSATTNRTAITLSKQWIHFRRSVFWPPTSISLQNNIGWLKNFFRLVFDFFKKFHQNNFLWEVFFSKNRLSGRTADPLKLLVKMSNLIVNSLKPNEISYTPEVGDRAYKISITLGVYPGVRMRSNWPKKLKLFFNLDLLGIWNFFKETTSN